MPSGPDTDAEAVVVVLGSAGGPTPKVGRRPVAHALEVAGEISLVDCGNGVAGQLVEAGLDLAKLRRVLITHHHIDHVADVAVLLHLAWSRLRAPVRVIGPPPLRRLFELHYEAFEVDIRSRMADEGWPHLRELVDIVELTSPGSIDCGVAQVTAATVEHPPIPSFGYRVDVAGRSVCFSGDTRPSQAVAELARDVDLLVHETTYLNNAASYLPTERAQRVLTRMRSVHSEPVGAARIAAAAGARALLLSPVGAFGPTSDDEIRREARSAYSGPISIGRDFLRVPVPSHEEVRN
ncbi:ribonuclease BN (tRNA processing enzyme) [Actinokineospora baliensis]|uniref:MBL fold metallo-hydrolase n=1 Tax=Actinokineospora baliensis TaxID=547056 RepID=UPI00195E4AF3|nr:MBL fold metallo-hydrolase [Actinokineospora baliensis]MBM7774080.1 ribonuclease BN (tRNA processing enzyme) [Actinokineospora baliensis]